MKNSYNLVTFCCVILCTLLLVSDNVAGKYEEYTIPMCHGQATVIVQFTNMPRTLDYGILDCTFSNRDRNLDYWNCNCQQDGETIIQFFDNSNIANKYHIIVEYYIAPKLIENINQIPPSQNDIINQQNKRIISYEIIVPFNITKNNQTEKTSVILNTNNMTIIAIIIFIFIISILIVGSIWAVRFFKKQNHTVSENTLRQREPSDEEVLETIRRHLGK